MRYSTIFVHNLILLLLLTCISCQQKEFSHQKNSNLVFKSTYTLELKKANTNLQTEMILPVILLQLDYIVTSDGVRSFISGINPALEDEVAVDIKSNDIIAYTNCEKGMGMILDSEDRVESVFKLKTHIFSELRKEDITIGDKVYATQVLECNDGIVMNVNESAILSSAINVGGCYQLERGLLRMTGVNKGTQIIVVLKKYEMVNFDFARFDELLEQNRNLLGDNEMELFWN